MTQGRAPDEPYTTGFDATVERRDGRAVALDRTYFYAESGGQPADRGTIDGVRVTGVQHVDGDVVHTLAEEPDFEAGDRVAGRIDEAFRTYCMRAHTASHVLYGAGRGLLDDLGYGGFDIGEEKVRIDFRTSSGVDDETLVELERRANGAIWESRTVDWETVPVEEARRREEVAFNTKTEEGVFAEDDGVRIVTVGAPENGDGDGAWDVAACGGTHVRNTREIGPITVLDRSNPGEGLTRVELAVGPAAIEHRARTTGAALDAARTLGVGVSDLPDAARRQVERVEELEDERRALSERLAEAQIDALRGDGVTRDGATWLVGSVEGLDSDVLADRARALVGGEVDVAVLVDGDERSSITVASDAEDVDASEVVDRVTSEYGGGGGGGPPFAQGGGIDAPPAEVVESVREA